MLGQYCYQLALSLSEAGYVNILSSSSGLFALVLAAMFPSTPGDRFTLSKLLAIAVNIAGVVGTHTQLALNGGRLLPRLRWQITIGPSFGGRTVISIEIIPVMK